MHPVHKRFSDDLLPGPAHKHGKFATTQAHNMGFRATSVLQVLRDCLDHLVSGGMTHTVISRLEPVDTYDKQKGGLFSKSRAL